MRKQKTFLFIAIFLYVISFPADIFAQRGGASGGALEIKLASPLPRNSPWGQTLDRIASEWARVTNNEVRLRILHNGQEGGETQMLASLSSNNIQAALFTSFGLSTICPSVMTLSVPFYIKTDAQLTAVLREVTPIMEDQVAKTDFFVVAWSKIGWVNVFSKDPVFAPDDLRRQRIATSSESKDLNTVLKTMGFQMVEVEMTDVGTKLMSGAIAAIYQNPAAVVAFQLHRTLRNMMATPIAPAMGGIVMNRVTWNKISPAKQQEILRVTRRIAVEFDSSMVKTTADAMSVMTREGLTVNRPSQAQEALWNAEIERAVPSLLGTVFDRDIYQKIGEVLARTPGGR